MVYGPRVTSSPGSPSGTSLPASSNTLISSRSLTGAPELSSSRWSGSSSRVMLNEPLSGAVDLLRGAVQRSPQAHPQFRRESRTAVLDDLQRGQVELACRLAGEPVRDQR